MIKPLGGHEHEALMLFQNHLVLDYMQEKKHSGRNINLH